MYTGKTPVLPTYLDRSCMLQKLPKNCGNSSTKTITECQSGCSVNFAWKSAKIALTGCCALCLSDSITFVFE